MTKLDIRGNVEENEDIRFLVRIRWLRTVCTWFFQLVSSYGSRIDNRCVTVYSATAMSRINYEKENEKPARNV